MEEKKPVTKSPIELLFKLGDKITKGDPVRQQDFTYYMIWILFLAFLGLFITNLVRFIQTLDVSYLFWMLIGFAIMSLQYFTLKNFYEMRKARKNVKVEPDEEHKVETVEEMLGGFKK